MTVLDTVSKVAQNDEGTAKLLVELCLYEALCDHADRLQPAVDQIVSKMVSQRAARGLLTLSKSDRRQSPEAADLAEQLHALVDFGKDDFVEDDKNTKYWDAREHGRFARGRASQGVGNTLDILAQDRGDKLGRQTKDALTNLVGTDATTYSRARSIGNGLTSINSPETRALGTIARVAGEIGPEAQAALEPGIRRTAYRYRGTERRPAVELQRDARILANLADGGMPEPGTPAFDTVSRWSKELAAHKTQQAMSNAGMRGGGRREVLSPGAVSYAMIMDEARDGGAGRTPDQIRLDAVGDFATMKLRPQVPDLETAKISRAAGRMPPSLGILIDKDGRVVSEAMGFNGDHYLPFDLKNLKQLKGGQYVRTRTQGGPTDEDIYTGLMTGARQMQVVSNSGVFTVEFDPDLRGGRRYSDKARQMVDRYSRLVAKIEEGSITANDIPKAELDRLKQHAIDDATGSDGSVNPALADKYFTEAKTQAYALAEFEGIDEDKIRAQAKQIAQGEWKQGQVGNKPRTSNQTSAKTEQEVFNELKAQAYEKTYRKYQANGEGYHAALKALQQEFPYFIRRVNFESLGDYSTTRAQLRSDEPIPRSGGRDKGYTQRGKLSPASHGEDGKISGTIEPGRARTASQLKGGKGSRDEAAATTATDGEGEGEASTAPAAGAAGAIGFGAGAAAGAARSSTATGREEAKTWEEALKPTSETKKAVFAGIEPVFQARFMIDGLGDAPGGFDDKTAHEITSWDKWTAWVATNKRKDAKADWLMDPKTDEANFERIDQSIDALESSFKQDPSHDAFDVATPEALTKARATVARLRQMRQPFADAQPNMDIADPSFDPNPQPFPEILKEGPSVKNLDAYLVENKDVKTAIEAMQGKDDEAIAAEIGEKVSELDRILRLDPQDPARKKFELDGEDGDLKKTLRAQQRAWTVKRAMGLAAMASGQEPPPFAKRLRPRLLVHDPSSPVAKALQARLRSRR